MMLMLTSIFTVHNCCYRFLFNPKKIRSFIQSSHSHLMFDARKCFVPMLKVNFHCSVSVRCNVLSLKSFAFKRLLSFSWDSLSTIKAKASNSQSEKTFFLDLNFQVLENVEILRNFVANLIYFVYKFAWN